MTRLTNILNRATVAPSPSPAEDTGNSSRLVRSNGARNLHANTNLPAPIGKREQAKRFIGAAFSASATPTALDGPVRRQARPAAARTPAPQAALAREQSAALLDRFNALQAPPQDIRSSAPPDPHRAYPQNPALRRGLSTIHEVDGEDEHG